MNVTTKSLALTAVLALCAVPALALPPQVPQNQGTAHIPDNQGTQHAPDNPGPPADPGSQAAGHKPATPGPDASRQAKGKAYGRYCATESKKHVAGQQGTPFSKCVTAMAKLATGKTANPTTACKTLSKKHVDGQKGTPFSKCVSAAAKLKHDQDDATETESETPSAS
ncbi:MAG: hypothetical protein QOI73_358 [Solirubrobacteraceae bacterium]|nr:hypothetical protein [Solirubrobacteraceae bacterium]